MSILLIFCVLAAAGWLLLSVIGRDSSDRPDASVAEYSRAMAALSTQAPRPSHPAARTAGSPRPRPRTAPPRNRGNAPRRRPSAAPRPSARR